MNKKLKFLIQALDKYQVFGNDTIISGISDDSRKVKKGNLFVAIKGATHDSHQYIPEAISQEASAVVGEEDPKPLGIKDIPYIKVPNSRKALSLLASAWYNYPSKKLKMIGVTGTDGKTTTASLIHHLLNRAGFKVGLVSTVKAIIGESELETGLHVTNPEPMVLQRFLSAMLAQKCQYAVLEVTSHGLDQERIAGINFDIAVLTNITHEHIDYHNTWDKYRKAKIKLFNHSKTSVLNKDDQSYAYILKKISKKTKIVSYAINTKADYQAFDIRTRKETSSFKVRQQNNLHHLSSTLVGEYNVLNILASLATVRYLGVGWPDIKKALKTFRAPIGRLEEIPSGKDFKVYIDFAHTPNSLKAVLNLFKKMTTGKVISVFGCAGERDVQKRLLMGEISAKIADISIFTAEDSRSEDIHKIIGQMVTGAYRAKGRELKPNQLGNLDRTATKNFFIRIPERGEAIAFALQKVAKKGDIVVICGKGHEKSMCYDTIEHPWSDHKVVADAIKAKKDLAAIVLAAGRGTRLKSKIPKVLHKIAGRPMITYTLGNLRASLFEKIVVVVGYKGNEVMKTLGGAIDFARQPKLLGTANAVSEGLKLIPAQYKDVVIINGDDSAFYSPETIRKVMERHRKSKAVLTFVSLKVEDPSGLGRVIRDDKGKLVKIVEEKDATRLEKKVREINDGLYVIKRMWLKNNLTKVKKNKETGEYYLVDLVKIALQQKKQVEAYKLKDSQEWFGINNKIQLKEADEKMRAILRQQTDKQ